MRNLFHKGLGIVLVAVSAIVLGWTLATSAAPVTIELFHMTFLPDAQRIVDEAVAAWEASHPDVKVRQTVVSWQDAYSKFVSSLAAGTAPDIVELPSDWAVDGLAGRQFLPLNEYAPPALLDGFIPASLQAGLYHDQYFALPWETSPTGFYYRRDLFAAAGLDPARPPANWNELVDYGKKLTRQTSGRQQWGLAFEAYGGFADAWWLPFIYQAGGQVVKTSGDRWVSDLRSPESVKGMQFYYDLVNTHKIAPPGVVGMEWEQVKNGFALGDYAMMINGMFVMNLLFAEHPELRTDVGTAVLPAGPGGRAVFAAPNSFYITRQSKNPKAAIQFLEFFFSGNPSYASRYCMAAGIVGMQKQFAVLEYAQDETRSPFVESLKWGITHPLVPGYGRFRETMLNPALQALLLGKRSVSDTVAYLDKELNRLLGER